MAFHINTYDLPPIHNYETAHRYWNKIEPWRGSTDTRDERPLAGRAHKNKTIRKLADGSIAMRLHNTDVVTYHPDDSITLTAYPSISTDLFAQALTPPSVSTRFNTNARDYYIQLETHEGWRVYQIKNKSIRLQRAYELAGRTYYSAASMSETARIPNPTINRQRAKQALKDSGFDDFAAWYKAARAMGKRFEARYEPRNNRDIVMALKAGPSQWENLISTWALGFTTRSTTQVLNHVKMIVHKECGCIDILENDWVFAREFQNIMRRQSKYL